MQGCSVQEMAVTSRPVSHIVRDSLTARGTPGGWGASPWGRLWLIGTQGHRGPQCRKILTGIATCSWTETISVTTSAERS